jgi:hypothetical protein
MNRQLFSAGSVFSQVLLKSLPQSVLAPWSTVLIAGFPKWWILSC